MHDLVIRNGTIVDGTGAEPAVGDIAIDDETITAIGGVETKGRQEIEAEGKAVTPGFIDLHTHFDAQAGWDPMLTPVSWHGVTTALFGNCGVTFAPCKPADREFLAGMMETVEDIPKDAILNGLSWDWESYGEYLDSVEELHPAINVAGLVGHCASRFYVMGERAIDGQPTADEITQIADLIGRSVAEGAIGFSTNRFPDHVLPDGRSIPGTFAQEDELIAISRAVGANGGLIQSVLDYQNLDEEMALLGRQGVAANTRVLFSAPFQPGTGTAPNGFDKGIRDMRANGVDVSGLTLPRSGGFVVSLRTDTLFRTPAWRELRKLDFSGRLATIRHDDKRQTLIDEVKADPRIERAFRNYYWLGDGRHPTYVRDDSESLLAQAGREGVHPIEIFMRHVVESNGEAMFHSRFFNQDLDILETYLSEDWMLPGIGDAGAHVSQIMDSGWATFMLAHWYRDKGVFTLPETVRRLTSAAARVLGFTDRGSLIEGQRADVNVIDIDRLAERQPELVHDFPGGAPRFIQQADGYVATVCNGTVVLRDDELTGERAGQVLRNAS